MEADNPLSGQREAVITAVRVAMARKNISGRVLADRVGIKQSAFSRRMHGDIAFTVEELAQIAAGLGCTVVDLIEDVEPAVIAGAA
ncbi:MAG: hypothetical protein QOJ49_1254 [Actinomycetota bacterium]|jgi:transcriptional regulator with XRE-family HTH domain|nr:hypothetical protein [Actinomycetota bacterium]